MCFIYKELKRVCKNANYKNIEDVLENTARMTKVSRDCRVNFFKFVHSIENLEDGPKTIYLEVSLVYCIC